MKISNKILKAGTRRLENISTERNDRKSKVDYQKMIEQDDSEFKSKQKNLKNIVER